MKGLITIVIVAKIHMFMAHLLLVTSESEGHTHTLCVWVCVVNLGSCPDGLFCEAVLTILCVVVVALCCALSLCTLLYYFHY